MSYMFCGCWNLEVLDLSNFDTGKVNNMYQIFYACFSLAVLYIGKNTNLLPNFTQRGMILE